jgi:ribose 5-phosphate isomerase RpiB
VYTPAQKYLGAYGTVITQAWLNARFEGDRHERRVGMLSTLNA